VQAVAGVSMTVHPNQTLAVVGESGCGKSVTAMSTMQLIPRPPGRFDRGSILFDGEDILSYTESQMLGFRSGSRANNAQMMTIASKLNDLEIKAVSDYIAGLR
jgi:ABC-type dipeptide/oligopeptide/nickel transport system ATPase component